MAELRTDDGWRTGGGGARSRAASIQSSGTPSRAACACTSGSSGSRKSDSCDSISSCSWRRAHRIHTYTGTPIIQSWRWAEAPPPVVGDPTNLTATGLSSGRVRLSWTDGSTDEAGYITGQVFNVDGGMAM